MIRSGAQVPAVFCVALAAVPLLAGCGGHREYTRDEDLDRVECSLTGAGGTSMPRKACLEQGGVVF